MIKHKFVIVGGGTAGIICATFIKKIYNDLADVTVIYDHKNPSIGVGESLTPIFTIYLNYVGITPEELIKSTNSTLKIGLRYQNWLNKNDYFYHPFTQDADSLLLCLSSFNSVIEICNDTFDYGPLYSAYFFENNKIPNDLIEKANQGKMSYSLHIDAVSFSRYVENKFKNQLNIIDGVVQNSIKDCGFIKSLMLSDGRNVDGDFFIDASGFQRILIKDMEDARWIDKKTWLPVDRCIPNPLPFDFEEIPPYTTAAASDNGWIFNVPLQHRWGTGYIYSSEYISDDLAFSNFEKYLTKNFGKNSLHNKNRVLRFESGYWKDQWIKNCLCVGLASGFAEPLEATNVHHVVLQMIKFLQVYNFRVFDHDVNHYNKQMVDFYDNAYLFLRFVYHTEREDSEFWKYMTNNAPKEILDLSEKMRYNVVDSKVIGSPSDAFSPHTFGYLNFTTIANGFEKIDRESYYEMIKRRNNQNQFIHNSNIIRNIKNNDIQNSISHIEYIQSLRSK